MGKRDMFKEPDASYIHLKAFSIVCGKERMLIVPPGLFSRGNAIGPAFLGPLSYVNHDTPDWSA